MFKILRPFDFKFSCLYRVWYIRISRRWLDLSWSIVAMKFLDLIQWINLIQSRHHFSIPYLYPEVELIIQINNSKIPVDFFIESHAAISVGQAAWPDAWSKLNFDFKAVLTFCNHIFPDPRMALTWLYRLNTIEIEFRWSINNANSNYHFPFSQKATPIEIYRKAPQ